MCTLSLSPGSEGYIVAMNRDELLRRGLARPPAVHPCGLTKIIHPLDVSGGSWIAVNSGGTTWALLNWNIGARSIRERSRGEVVLEVSTLLRPADADTRISGTVLAGVDPFRLVGISAVHTEVVEWRWNGMQLQQIPHARREALVHPRGAARRAHHPVRGAPHHQEEALGLRRQGERFSARQPTTLARDSQGARRRCARWRRSPGHGEGGTQVQGAHARPRQAVQQSLAGPGLLRLLEGRQHDQQQRVEHLRAVERLRESDKTLYPHLETTYTYFVSFRPAYRRNLIRLAAMVNEELRAMVEALNREFGHQTEHIQLRYSNALATADLSRAELLHPIDGWHASIEGHNILANAAFSDLKLSLDFLGIEW